MIKTIVQERLHKQFLKSLRSKVLGNHSSIRTRTANGTYQTIIQIFYYNNHLNIWVPSKAPHPFLSFEFAGHIEYADPELFTKLNKMIKAASDTIH
jgi:hypothetical protein